MATASESPQPLPVPAPITAVDEKDLITNVPESSHLLDDLKKAGAEINRTSETIESSKIEVILHVPTDPVLETLNNASEVHVAKEGECFLVPPPIAKLEKEVTARGQDYSVIVEPSSMGEKEITDDQTQEMLKKKEEEEISNREIITPEEIKENVKKEEGPNIPEGFDTIQTKTEEFIPKVGEETQKEEPLSLGTEIIVNKEAFHEERAQKVEELSFPKEDDPDETKADKPVAEEKTPTEVTASLSQSIEVSSHASLFVKVETEEALDKEEENSKLVTDKGIVTESQKEAEDQTELADQSIELEEILDDQRNVLTTTGNSSLVKEEISTATEEQKEETVEVKEVEERIKEVEELKEKDISAIEEPKQSSSQDADPKVQTLNESLHVSSKDVETTDSSEIAKIQELNTEGKEEDNAADDGHISENIVEKDEVIPPLDSDEKAEEEEVRAANDSHLTHAPIEETEIGEKLLEEIQEEEFVSSAPHAETKFNEELSALVHPTNLGESSKLVDGDDLESNAGKESEKPVDQETSIPPGTSTERNVMDLEHKESSDKLETNEIVSSNLEREHNEESKPELDELIKDTDDVLIQQEYEGSDRNDNHEEQTTQEESYKTGLREASAENVVTEAETSPTIPTEEVVQKDITHEESSSTEIAPSAIVAETIQGSEEVEEDNTIERAEEVQTCVPTEADTAESISAPEVTEMPEKDQTRELFVHSHTSKEDIENVEAVNPVMEEKSEANEVDILTNEVSTEVAVNEKIEVVDRQEESASTEIISLENDTVQKVRDSKPDSLSLENAEDIKDEPVSQSDPEIIKEELEEVTTGSVAVQQSDARQIIEDKPEEMETKKDLEELTTESTKEQLEDLQINKDEPTAHSQETETTKEELEEVTQKLAEEPQSEATKIVTTERALQSTEPECKDEDIEEETTESGHKQQVEEIITSEPVAELEEAKTEVTEEVETDSAEEQQVEAIQIITNDQIRESEEAKKGEVEEVTAAPAEEQQSQASQIITHKRSIQLEDLEFQDSEEITTELAEEQQEEVIIENEPIPQSEAGKKEKLEEVTAESVNEPESEVTQAIMRDQVAQSEEREIKKEDLVEGVIRPAEEANVENELISQAEVAKKELQELTANPEEEPQSEATAGEAQKEKLEELTTNPAKESQSEATHATDCEQLAQSEELDIKKENLDEGTIDTAEEVVAESAKEIESELAKEQQAKAIQIVRNYRIPESEEAKKEDLEELTAEPAEEQQSQASQIITRDQFIQPEEPEIKIDPEETTKELAQEQQDEVIIENELIPQSEAAKKEELEEVAAESAKEPKSEATQAVTHEQVAQSEEREIKEEDLVEEASSQAEEEAKKEELQEVTENPEEEPQSKATAGEAKIEKPQEVTTEPEKEPQSGVTHAIDCDQVAQSEELGISKENLEEGTTEPAEGVAAESARETESEASQAVVHEQVPQSGLLKTKTEDIEEVTVEPAEEVVAESAKEIEFEASQAVVHEQVLQLGQLETKKEDIEEGTVELAEEVAAESAREIESEASQAVVYEQVPQSGQLEAKKEDIEEGIVEPAEEVAAESARETKSEASQAVVHEQVPQSRQLKTKTEDIEEVTVEPAEEVVAESAKEIESKASQVVVHEQVPQSGQLETKKEDIEEGTVEPAEEVTAESAREIESEASQTVVHEQVPQSGQLETKKENIEEVTVEPAEEVVAESAKEIEFEASQAVVHEQVLQLGQLETKKEDIEEGTVEPAEEVAAESAREIESEASQAVVYEQVPQSGQLETKKEDIEEGTVEPAEKVAGESARETKSEASQAVVHEQVPQSRKLETKKDDIEERTVEPAEEVTAESAREIESEVSQAVVHEQVPQSGQLETKKEDIEEGTVEPAEEVTAESAREIESEARQAVVHEQVPQSGQLETKKEDIEEGTVEPAEEVIAESAREIESEARQAVVHEQVPQSGQLETKKEDIEEGTVEPAEEVIAESAREIKSEASQTVVHEQVPQLGQLETKKEDIEEGTVEPAEEVTAESAREIESEVSQAVVHEQVPQSGQLETKKEDIEEGIVEPSEEQQLQAIIQNELISQSEEAKDEQQSEAIPTINHEQVAQSEDTDRKKVILEKGTVETVGEEHQETTQVIENEPTAQSEEIKKEELQEVANKSVEERDLEAVPIITREQVAQSEELENEHLGEASTESTKEQQLEAIQIIKSESTDQSEETKNEIDGIRKETEEQPLEAVQMIHEQVTQSEVPQTKKGEVEETTTYSAEEQKTEVIHMIKDELIAQLEEDEREEHEEVPTQSVDELQTEAVQIINREQAVQSEQKDTEDLEAKEHVEVATELAEGHQSEAIQIIKEQVGQSDELETEIKGAETVTTELADEPKYEETLSIKNDQTTQSVESQSKIADLAAVTTELAEEQLLGTLQINKKEEATRVEEPTAKTEDLVALPTPSMEDEQFEAREITKKEISVEESAGEKEAVQPEDISNEIQQTDDIKPSDFPQKQDVNQQTEGAEKVDATDSLKEEIEHTEGPEKVDATESLKEEIEQSEGAEKVDATESLKEEIVQIDNETSKHPLLHDDETVPKVQNSEPILSETEKGQSENDEILREQQCEAPLPLATEAEPEKKEDEEKPEEISVVICDDVKEGPEVETIQQVENLPKETATELATSKPRQSQEISEVEGAQSDSLGVSQGEALLELELGTVSTSCMPSEQSPQDVIETERSLDYLEEVDHQQEKAEKARETALEACEQVAQPEVEKENPEEVITNSIQEPTEGTQITDNKAMEEILQEKEMVSDSHQGSPEEENTHVIQPSEEKVIIDEEEVQANLEKKVSVATLEEKEPEGFGEVVGREILREEIMQEENDGGTPIKEVEVSEETSKEILELAKVKEAAELKNDEEVTDLQEASSLSENPQPNLNNETGEEKPQDVDILKSDEPEEIVKLKTAEQPTIGSNENETKDSESEAHESSQPIQTESAHTTSHDVCQDEEILESKDDDNTPSEQLPGEVIATKITEDNLEVQSREKIPDTADSEEKKEKNPEEVITESVQEEQIDTFSQTTQNSVEEHEIKKEVITEPREVILPEQITKELHEKEPKEEETESATKIEKELRITGTSQDRSELIKEDNSNDGFQSPEKEAVEEDLKKAEEEFKTVGSSADSGKQEVQTSDSLTPVAKEDNGILPEEDVSEKVLKDEVADRDMDFKGVKVVHVSEELELKVSNDSAEEKAVLEEESSAKELLQEEINRSSVVNLVVSEELDKQTVTESLKNEVSSGNDTESISVTAEDKEKLSQEVETKTEFQVEELNAIVPPSEEKDSAKTEEKDDFLVQEEDEKEVATTTKPLSEEDLLKTDSSKEVDATSEKAETVSEDTETPSGQPRIEMSVQEEEKREVESTQVVVDAIPDEKNEETLTILSCKEELTEADSSKETVEMSKKGSVLFEDTQKEVPEKEQAKKLDIQDFHESHVESNEMFQIAADCLVPKQASQELEGSEEVDGRKTLEKEIRQEESATTELLAVNADKESNKEVREIEPISVEALKPIELHSETGTSKLENHKYLSDKQDVSTLSEEPKSQPDEIAKEKLEEPAKKAEDVEKEIETHGLESKPHDSISAPALTIANAGGQNVVEGTSTPTLLDDSQDEEILYVGNIKENVSSVTSELPTAVIETEITKDSVEDTSLQSGFAEKMRRIAPHVEIHEEVSQLEYAEIKKDDIEEVTTKSVGGEQIEAIPVMINDSTLVEKIVEKEEVTESHQGSPHEETLKEVKETDELKAEQTVMQFSEDTGKAGTRDYVEEEITREERALKDQLEADAEDKKTYVFIDDERQDINEKEAKLNLENNDSLPKLEAEVQLPEVTLGTKDERETFITSDEEKPQTELGVQTAKLTAEEKNASSKAGDDNIGNGIRKAADEEQQPPAEVVGNPEKHTDHEKDASAPLKPEGGEFGIKFGVDEKGQEPCIKEPGNAVVDERCPEGMPEKSSQSIEPKPEFDFEKMGNTIGNTDTYSNIADEKQLNKPEEQGELLATERAWKLEETPDAASLENPKDVSAKPVQESTAEGAQKAENFSDKDHTHCEETAQKDLEDEGEENKREDSGSDGPVLVEASKDMEANRGSPHKKHHNILSGVGSKVRHSISKVKKAITGKSSSHPKSESPK